jgi:glutaredoxin
MPNETIVVYGADWCGDCRRAKRFLNQHNIPFRWIDIESDKQGEQFVIKANRGMRSIPTIVLTDGSLLVEPSNADLAGKFLLAEFA